jgi:hypothetical protein
MPAAIPLVGAAFSISSGVAAAGGLSAIAAGGLSALTLTSGLMIAGGAMTAIGTLTGNKKLATIGSVLGLAGGIGSALGKGAETAAADVAASAAGEAGASTTANVGGEIAQGAVADTATGVAESASKTASATGEALRGGGLIESATQGPLDALGQEAAAASFAPPAAPAAEALTGTPMAAPGAPAPAVVAPSEAARNYGTYATESRNFVPNMAGGPDTGTGWWDKMKDFGKDFTKFTKENPTLTQVGGGLIYGVAQGIGQDNAVKKQAAERKKYDEWVSQRYSDSVRNLTIGAVGGRKPVPSGGIIGGARG